jgi:hypothetical protein
MNYSRFAVQLLTWLLRLSQANGIEVPASIKDKAERLLELLLALQNHESGRLPNYGPNDGALIFPLSSCDYLDYRPSLGALNAALGREAIYPSGIWDEESFWFGVGRSSSTPSASKPAGESGGAISSARESRSFNFGGFYTFRYEGDRFKTQAHIRCATYRQRPSHADMLHLDVWYNQHNALIDPGTYSYNAPAPWPDYFAGTPSHNTVSVDGRHQMKKLSRFMWVHWTRSHLLHHSQPADGMTLFCGEHYGYSPVTHRRTVLLDGGVYFIYDDLWGEGEHSFRLHWLVNDLSLTPHDWGATILLPQDKEESASPPYSQNHPPDNLLRQDTEKALTLRFITAAPMESQSNWVRGQEDPPRGWHSVYYGERLPAWSYERTSRGGSARFITICGPEIETEACSPFTFSRLEEILAAKLRKLPTKIGDMVWRGRPPI